MTNGFLDNRESVLNTTSDAMPRHNLLDGVFPNPPFFICVPPLWHVLEETGSEVRPKRACYLTTQCDSGTRYADHTRLEVKHDPGLAGRIRGAWYRPVSLPV